MTDEARMEKIVQWQLAGRTGVAPRFIGGPMDDETKVIPAAPEFGALSADPVRELLPLVTQLEDLAERAQAIAQQVRDGSVYRTPRMQTLKDYAKLLWVLEAVRDAAESADRACRAALDGTEEGGKAQGHRARMADLMRAQGVTQVRVEGLGTAYCRPVATYYAPGRGSEHWLAYLSWMRNHNQTAVRDEVPWRTLQSVCAAAEEAGEALPSFITHSEADAVRMRRT